jgi:hypothetical protein
MSETARKRSHFPKLIAVLAVGFLGLIIVAIASPTTPTNGTNATNALLNLDGHQYPAVVASVDGTPITGAELAQRVFIVQHNPHVVGDPSQFNVEQVALEQLIVESVLLKSANDVGVTVSEQEAADYALARQNAILNGDDPVTRDQYAATAAQMGVQPQDLASDPRTIDSYRQGMLLGRMYDHVLGTLPADQRNNPVAFEGAVRSFVDQHAKDIQIRIQP